MDPVQLALSLILRGCRSAKELEARLGDLANQPEALSKSCDEIINMFASAKEMLNNAHPHQGSSQQQTDTSLHELLNYGVIRQAMDMIQSGRTSISIGAEIQAMEVSDSGKGSSSSSQRSHRSRKHDQEKCRMRVPAPQMGNTDFPPEDNYTWRKYGQKEILGSRYPRAYYRCTHQKMYNCPAKKQVQRLDNDFYTFEVTYIGQHTCHMSSTAPSIAPPPSTPLIQDPMVMVSQPTLPPPTSSSSVAPLGTWLSMEFSLGPGSSSGGIGGGDAGASSAAGGGGASMGSRYGRDVVEFPAVADMADAMFNSGSSSSNSMDFIFPHMEDK
ncbi:WRKY DNA-binding protein 70, putative isoform 1 [Hibiscus syriacus]|uniref:WRKY DNA-binding protein 70, putative isoform 1 n=1 Tax=Hibiscus syriacus TaxID=106335 RepID=A0A6A3B2C1_HIBSY|nr:WRKY transcription factor 55-like [Hibiscus syriacus]KAE8709229.1 WRKY DNA-binding protein 70, putative isoform 1 [Hibiscus syriacus]